MDNRESIKLEKDQKKQRTRASKGSGSIRERNGRFELRYTTREGEQKSKSFRSRKEAEKERRRITAEIDQGTYVEPSKMTLESWLDIWTKDYCGHIKPGTLIQYQGYITNHINPKLGKMKLCEIAPHDIQRFVNNLTYHGRKKDKTISYKTRKNIHGCLSAALKIAVQNRYISNNPATGVKIPKEVREQNEKTINPFSSAELSRFLPLIQEAKYKDIYTIALNTGLRLSEILGLRWHKIDFTKMTITIDSQLAILRRAGEKRHLAPTKYEHTRTFKVSRSVISLLKSIKRSQTQQRLAAGLEWQCEIEDLVFTNPYGRSIAHASVEHEFKNLVRKAGCPEHRIHDCRHTFSTRMLAAGASPKTLSSVLGHRSVAFTLDVYAHVSEEMSDDFAELAENVMSI